MRIRRTTVLCLVLAIVWASGCRRETQDFPTGVVLSRVLPGGSAEEAGLLAGDRLLSFRRAANPPSAPEPFETELSSCLDLALADLEQAPRGAVRILVERPRAGAAPRRIDLEIPWDGLKIRCRPAKAEDPKSRFSNLLADAQDAADRHQNDVAEQAFAKAEAAIRANGDPHWLAHLLDVRAGFRTDSGRLPEALVDAQEALKIRQRIAPDSLTLAQSHAALGLAFTEKRDNASALPHLETALALRTKLATESFSLAQAQVLLSRSLLREPNSIARAEELMRAAQKIVEQRAPESRLAGVLAMNLGVTERLRNRFVESESLQRRALRILRRIDPEAPIVADVLSNLAVLASIRGDYGQAEGFVRGALDIQRRHNPGGPGDGAALSNLGIIEMQRNSLEAAETHMLAALETFDRLTPNNPSSARTLTNLSTVARAAQANDRAESYASRALALHRAQDPDSTIIAYDLVILAELAALRGDKVMAAQRIGEAIAIANRQAASAELASVYLRAAQLLWELGQREAGQPLLERALQILDRVAPQTADQADGYGQLARLARHRGEIALAERHSARALDILDAAVGRLGGSDLDRSRTRKRFADLYRAAIEVALDLGDAPRAYHTLERFRSRTLLDLLSERDLEAPAEIPLALRNEARRIEADLATGEQKLGALDPSQDGPQIDILLAERSRLLDERETVRAGVRRASPRYAALATPKPLDLNAARKTLDADSLGLAYSLGERELVVFVLYPDGFPKAPPAGLTAHRIAVERREVEATVSAFRAQLLAKKGLGDPAFRALAERLSSWLLAPAAEPLAKAKRISISPDGALATLPFAALSAPQGAPDEKRRYVVERWSFSTVSSATLAAELRRAGEEKRGPMALVGFGDPVIPRSKLALNDNPSRELRGWFRFRETLSPLPASRAEVEGIGKLFGTSELRFGQEATEQRFLTETPRGRRVHFAGHALLDPRFPLESSLALSPPKTPIRAGDDGLLQAWEIFERLRLAADLVVLSACGTALGTESGGEGLLGLTRAFHFAGARAVLSSLWSVADRSTANLMARFYRHLARGLPSDVALSTAQREILALSQAPPFHWAAFQLDGDPRVSAGAR